LVLDTQGTRDHSKNERKPSHNLETFWTPRKSISMMNLEQLLGAVYPDHIVEV
jgi:hypothetical protein